MNDDTSVLFGLPGVRVARVDLGEGGGRVVHVETAENTSAPGCPSCGVVSTSVKGRVVTAPRDLPYGEAGLIVRWHKTRWRCRESMCARSSFTESIEQVPVGSRTTGRLRTAMGAAIGDAARSVSEVAASFGMSWPTAHAAFVEHVEALLSAPEPTAALGIDETRRGKPRWIRDEPVADATAEPDAAADGAAGRWRRVDPYDTGFVDLAGDQGLLGQREGRTSQCVVDWLREQSQQFRDGILFVAIDPAAVYAKAIRTRDLLLASAQTSQALAAAEATRRAAELAAAIARPHGWNLTATNTPPRTAVPTAAAEVAPAPHVGLDPSAEAQQLALFEPGD